MILTSILTKGEEELLTANLPEKDREPIIRWAKQARLDNYLLKMVINKKINVMYSDNPGITFQGTGEEFNYLMELRKSITSG